MANLFFSGFKIAEGKSLMRVSNINFINPQKNITQHAGKKTYCTGSSAGNKQTLSAYSSENIKANFMPSFGFSKKVGKANIIERNTGRVVEADVRRDVMGPFVTYNLNLGRKELGFLVMDRDTIYPEPQHVITFPTDNIPKVLNLRTIEGEKYSGIGTALIKSAVNESFNNNSYGTLWLTAEKGYEKNRSPYRSDENPIPFYYKIGFKSPDRSQDAYIRECLEKKEYGKLPNIAVLIFSPKTSVDSGNSQGQRLA